MNQLSPSILAADFTNLGEQIREVEAAGADLLHFDVMDGRFVPSISFGMPVMESIRGCTKLPFDVHLMIERPENYIKTFAELGADIITVHYEACEDVAATLRAIRDCGCRCGLSIKPETPVKVLMPFLQELDLVLIMGVAPGFGGQKLLPQTAEKLQEINEAGKTLAQPIMLEVDGGVTLDNVEELLAAGANVIVTGSAVFHGDIMKNVQAFAQKLKR